MRMGSSPFARTKESRMALFCAIYRFTHRGTNPPDPLRRYAPKSFDSSFYKTPGAGLGHKNGFSGYSAHTKTQFHEGIKAESGENHYIWR